MCVAIFILTSGFERIKVANIFSDTKRMPELPSDSSRPDDSCRLLRQWGAGAVRLRLRFPHDLMGAAIRSVCRSVLKKSYSVGDGPFHANFILGVRSVFRKDRVLLLQLRHRHRIFMGCGF